MALAYIDARDVMERLDSVMTPVNWQRSYSHADAKTICDLSLRIDGEWISKADGAGDSDIEAEKGAISDAFKRAAVNWGIGRYLYDIPSIWVAIDKFGQIEESEKPKLAALLKKHAPSSEVTQPDPAKLNAALAFAESCVEVFRNIVEPEDKMGYISTNWPKISACMKYPAAAKLLLDAGLVEEGDGNA